MVSIRARLPQYECSSTGLIYPDWPAKLHSQPTRCGPASRDFQQAQVPGPLPPRLRLPRWLPLSRSFCHWAMVKTRIVLVSSSPCPLPFPNQEEPQRLDLPLHPPPLPSPLHPFSTSTSSSHSAMSSATPKRNQDRAFPSKTFFPLIHRPMSGYVRDPKAPGFRGFRAEPHLIYVYINPCPIFLYT